MKKIIFQIVLLGVLVIPQITFASFDTNLSFGAKGQDVTELQDFLSEQGYYNGPVTGSFLSLTRAAVKSFQAQYGITSNGNVGPMTRAKINELLAPGTAVSTEQNQSSAVSSFVPLPNGNIVEIDNKGNIVRVITTQNTVTPPPLQNTNTNYPPTNVLNENKNILSASPSPASSSVTSVPPSNTTSQTAAQVEPLKIFALSFENDPQKLYIRSNKKLDLSNSITVLKGVWGPMPEQVTDRQMCNDTPNGSQCVIFTNPIILPISAVGSLAGIDNGVYIYRVTLSPSLTSYLDTSSIIFKLKIVATDGTSFTSGQFSLGINGGTPQPVAAPNWLSL